jgi:hypothetical protein
MDLILETERGVCIARVDDIRSPFFVDRFPHIDDPSYWYVNRINQYGNTIFNQLQAPRLLVEWDAFTKTQSDPNLLEVLADMRELIVRLADSMHCYLRFRGL